MYAPSLLTSEHDAITTDGGMALYVNEGAATCTTANTIIYTRPVAYSYTNEDICTHAPINSGKDAKV